MKRFKKLSLFLVATLMMATPFSAYAASEHAVPSDGTNYTQISREVQRSVTVGGAREARVQDVIDSLQLSKKSEFVSEQNNLNSTNASWYQLSDMSSFVYYAQAKNYSCGAASVRMALRYLTGSDYSESTIRTGCSTTTSGTYLSDMKTYINKQQSSNSYITKYGATKTTLKDNLYSGIVTYDAPPILGLCESTSSGWPFDLPAHFVAVYSVKSDKSEVAIADPWAGYVSSTSSYKWYDKSTDDLYTAYNAVNCGYMY